MDLISATPLLVGYNPVAICGRDYRVNHDLLTRRFEVLHREI